MPRKLQLTFAEDEETVIGISCLETGQTVDLSGLSPSEKAFCLMVACVDPEQYDGRSPLDCMVGQPSELAREQIPSSGLFDFSQAELLSAIVGGAEDDLNYIYTSAIHPECATNLDNALQMAARELHVDEHKCETLVAPLMEGNDE